MNEPARLAELRPQDLPRPPEAALRILAACADPDSDLGVIGAIVASDPGLTAELLRIVNSAYFGFDREIASIELAVSLLGLDALRTRVLCIAVRAAAAQADPRNLVLAEFMEDSVRRAVAARELASHCAVDADEAFAAGLLQDFGLLVLFHLHPAVPAARWTEMRVSAPAERLALELRLFGTSHDRVIADLAAAWSLPQALADGILAHHGDLAGSGLAGALGAADSVCALFTSTNPAASLGATEAALDSSCGLAGDNCRAFLAALPERVRDAAASLGIPVTAMPTLDDLTREVNMRLADENLSFQELTWELRRTIRERDELAAEKARELEIAREIQCALLPSSAEGCPISAVNFSAQVLSGDFYDFFQRGDGQWCFALGDVSGKGVTAALLMAKTCSLFRCLGKRLASPAEVMAVLNDELAETAVRGMFVTMIAGVLEPASGAVEFVNAGHPPPLLVGRDGRSAEVRGSGTPLGVVPGVPFDSQALVLGGASLYLYSDGLSEACLEGEGELGTKGFAALLGEYAALPPGARLEAVAGRLLGTPAKRRDDLTIAVITA